MDCRRGVSRVLGLLAVDVARPFCGSELEVISACKKLVELSVSGDDRSIGPFFGRMKVFVGTL